MYEIRSLLKISIFVICYALFFYGIPLPQPAFLGLLFPLLYIHQDFDQVKHIQVQLVLGFGGGILLGIIMIKVAIWSYYFGFVIMTTVVLLSFYFACYQSWLKLPFTIIAALVAMLFNLTISSEVLLSAAIFEKFLLAIGLSILLYGIINFLLGDKQYEYIPHGVIKELQSQFSKWNWTYARHSLCLYLSILMILLVQGIFGLPPVVFAIASGSAIVVLSGDKKNTKHNILMRIMGAALGIVLGIVQLMLLLVLPFIFIQVALILLLMCYAAHYILRYKIAGKILPQAAVTYLIIVAVGANVSVDIDAALLRLLGISVGVSIVYIVSLFFMMRGHQSGALSL